MPTVAEIAEAVVQKLKSNDHNHEEEHIQTPMKVKIDGEEHTVCRGCGQEIPEKEDDEDDE